MAEYIERGGKLFPTPFSAEEHGGYRQGWNHCLRAIYQMPAADAIEKLSAQNNELLFRCGQAEALIDYYQTGKLLSNEPPKEEETNV